MSAPPRFIPAGSERRRRRKSKAERIADDRISRAYYSTCCGIQISVMDIPRVFAEGRRAIASGADDAQLAAAIFGFVTSIAKAA